jgi:hypothetical protein
MFGQLTVDNGLLTMVQCLFFYPVISTSISPLSSSSIAYCKLVARISLNLAFEVFPQVTQSFIYYAATANTG